MSSSKKVLAGGVVLTLAVAAIATIYVPQYSEEGRERRETYQRTGQVLKDGGGGTRQAGSMQGGSRGSMYQNMSKATKKWSLMNGGVLTSVVNVGLVVSCVRKCLEEIHQKVDYETMRMQMN